MPTLYVVATPIGNLEDITLRALRVFKEVNYILCEDTRITKRLLMRYKISKTLISYHQHSSTNKINKIIKLLKSGKNLALVTDAGTPGISDPGGKLIKEVVKEGIDIIPVPGASALITLASVSGFPTDNFLFLGFPPHKNKRNKFFQKVIDSDISVIMYESPHRIIKSLEQLEGFILTNNKKYGIVVGRELTKKFESIYRGNIDEVIERVKGDKIKGEYTIILSRKK